MDTENGGRGKSSYYNHLNIGLPFSSSCCLPLPGPTVSGKGLCCGTVSVVTPCLPSWG